MFEVGKPRPKWCSFLSTGARRDRPPPPRSPEPSRGSVSRRGRSGMAGRLYTKSHEWLTVEGKSVTVGITDFAQAQLGDVVFLELPSPGRKLDAGESFGVGVS